MVSRWTFPSWTLRAVGRLLFLPFCCVAVGIIVYNHINPPWYMRTYRRIVP